MNFNKNFDKLPSSYIFAKISDLAKQRKKSGEEVFDLGVGDLSLPLAPVAVEAMKRAAEELGKRETFRGYPPYGGLSSLRKKISESYGSLARPFRR